MLRERDPTTGMYLPGPSSFEPLLQDPLVKQWLGSYHNAKTRESYARAFERRSGLTAKQLLDLEIKDARERIMDLVTECLDLKYCAAARQVQTAIVMHVTR
jgi:hypothetical protein